MFLTIPTLLPRAKPAARPFSACNPHITPYITDSFAHSGQPPDFVPRRDVTVTFPAVTVTWRRELGCGFIRPPLLPLLRYKPGCPSASTTFRLRSSGEQKSAARSQESSASTEPMIAVVPTYFPISLCLNHIPGSFGALGGRGKSSKPRIYSGSTPDLLPTGCPCPSAPFQNTSCEEVRPFRCSTSMINRDSRVILLRGTSKA